ncbi:hypothetical protein [Paraburkholderia sp. SOS3]|jgi:hypothetical protein|uniref:hypothetical protein n=1 Tax=Paraburkholderia sp. SOS3 TaxID=1926494 RepID=UPI00094776A9|nr:hypothetical protein [Paraburkholderia sp. SOS3]APR39298.1 hypothetical protein BTO02_28765 [Paraburkholderia sp. SOS3]
MIDVSKAWFDECRAAMATVFELAALAQGWRNDLHELEGKRIARDHAAARRMQEASRAVDWHAFSADAQSALRDYLSATAQIWQDGIRIAGGNQGALASALERASGNGFAASTGWWRGLPAFDASAQPAREWMSIFERMMAGTGAPAGFAANLAEAAPDASQRRAARGERHVG